MLKKCLDCGSTDIKISSGTPCQSNSFIEKIMQKIENAILNANIRSGNPLLGRVQITCNKCGKTHLLCVN